MTKPAPVRRSIWSSRLTAFATVAAVLVVAGSAAWACVPQPRLITVQPRSSGPAGAEVTVSALGFDPGRAEIRWNAADGELLASGNGPDFSERIRIPPSDEGLYHLVVLARSPGGEIGNTAAVSFHVTAPAAAPVAPVAPAQQPPASSSAPAANEGPSSAALLAGGVALLSLGGLAGTLLARRRRGPAPVG